MICDIFFIYPLYFCIG